MAFKKLSTLRAIKSNPGIRAAYRKQMDALIKAMSEDMTEAILAEYGKLEHRITQDAARRSPSERLQAVLEKLGVRWERKFSREALPISTRYITSILKRVRSGRTSALKELGITVKINPSRLTDERFQALIQENASLIKTIPRQYAERVQGAVQRSISSGMDRDALQKELRSIYGITERRAKMIARDQTAKATQALAEVTDKDLGFTHGVWVRVPGRYSSRPTHIAMNGKTFELSKGLYDSATKEFTKPGQEICCMCTYRVVIPSTWQA
jgi:uncharacterized protein with gpF-like domain